MSESGKPKLPQGWTFATLHGLSEKIVDGSHNPPVKRDTGYPMLSARNIENGRIVFDDFRYISPEAFEEEDARTQVRPDSVLLTIVGTIGRSAIVPQGMQPFALQRSVAVLKPIGMLPKFCMYQFQAPHIQRFFIEEAKGTAQKGIYLKALSKLTMRVPPLREQSCIVEEIEKQFTRLDAGVAALERARTNLKRYRASVLKTACEGRLVPTEAELARAEGRGYEPADRLLARILKERRAKWEADQLAKMQAQGKIPKDDKWKEKYEEPTGPDTTKLPELPEGWVWVTLDAIAEVIDPNPSHRMPKYENDGIPFISSENFTASDQIDFNIGKRVTSETWRDQRSRFTIRPGDFALSRIGTIGKTRFLPPDKDYCLSHALVVISARSVDLDRRFLRLILSSHALFVQAQSGVQSVGVPDLGMGKIRSFVVPLPPLPEQHRIVAEVERRLSVIDELEATVAANLKRSERLRQSILKNAFEGKLVPQNPSDEPVSVLLERIHTEREANRTKEETSEKVSGKPHPRTRKATEVAVQEELFAKENTR